MQKYKYWIFKAFLIIEELNGISPFVTFLSAILEK